MDKYMFKSNKETIRLTEMEVAISLLFTLGKYFPTGKPNIFELMQGSRLYQTKLLKL